MMLKTSEVISFLHNTAMFSNLSQEALQLLAMNIRYKDVPAHEIVLNKGDAGNSMYIVINGQVQIHDEQHVVTTLNAGDYFGELSLLDTEVRSMSVTAVTDSSLLEITHNSFYLLIQNHPNVGHHIIPELTKRMREQSKQIIVQLKNKEAELQELVNQRTMQLQLKNKEIVDSIHYAKHVQEAIMPSVHLIEKHFKDSFVLYLPKDIVSGDFYWMTHTENKILIAAADCTGHGVSGALMSMLGVSLLDQIVNGKKITTPSEILNQLHIAIVESLHQQNTQINNGMDICLCCFDLENNVLQFSGANRPLIQIANGELIMIAADKVPIGGTQIDRPATYTNHVITLNVGNQFYLTTDGYADQFGGEAGKKLMTKKLKEMIVDMRELSMTEQKKYLENYFNLWKNKFEQVDDVLVIGVRV